MEKVLEINSSLELRNWVEKKSWGLKRECQVITMQNKWEALYKYLDKKEVRFTEDELNYELTFGEFVNEIMEEFEEELMEDDDEDDETEYDEICPDDDWDL